MTQELDSKLEYLKQLEEQLERVSFEKETLRKEVLEILKNENLSQYKNDVATISQVEKKTIKYIKPVEEVLASIEQQKLVKYIEVIPEEIIPEHKLLNKNFEKDVKEGKFILEGIEVETKFSPMIRFN